ncbi:unnamed protein product [Larinioides sclopetarius]|uniref:PIH1 N-terminal domain-containing protein n=1 Tax=Larinioides sclopetarius TaxID=280406 RepID=A0AAV2B734_9ARAC
MLLGKNPNIATASGDNFLEVNPKGGRSILNITEESDPFDLNLPFELNSEDGKQVFPKPGFCIKSKTNEDVKVFINMCHCEDVPKPDEKLMSPKDAGEDEAIRFPLGLGLPRKDKDKSGKECICFDVVINSEFLNTLLKDEDARSFVLSLCIQGIADKYGILVRDDCCVKLTKPYHGTVQRHFVKNTDSSGLSNPFSIPKGNLETSAPLIRLMESSSGEEKPTSDNSSVQSVRPKTTKLKSNQPVQSKEKEDKLSAIDKNPKSVIYEPSSSKLPKKQRPNVEYGLFQVPSDISYPTQYVLEVHLHYSLDDSITQVNVFVSNNRVVITEKMYNYNLDLSLPNPVIPERCRANFYDGTLVVVLPLVHNNHGENH